MMNESLNKNWREDALNEALLLKATGGNDTEDALVARARQQDVSRAVIVMYLPRPRTMTWLETRTERYRPLCNSNLEHLGSGLHCEPTPYAGWYGATWNGAEIEVVFPPTSGTSGDVLLISADHAALTQAASDLTRFANSPERRCLRFSNGWEEARDLDAEIGRIQWDDVVLPEATMNAIRSAVEDFAVSRERFHALGFPWRRGILLVGPPGTGKTMVCRAAASSCDLPFLYVRDISGHDNARSVKAVFERARALAPCMLVFEDMDGFVTPGNRTVFLNEMDGMQNNDGLLILASSNHPEKIDEALLKRPSRFDRVFHIGLPGIAERREYCRRIIARSNLHLYLEDSVDRDGLAEQIARRTDGFTPAYLKEVFVSAALACVQDGTPTLGQVFVETALKQVNDLRDFLRKADNPEALGELSSGATMGLRG